MIWYLLVVFIYFWVTKHQGGWEIFYSPVNVQGNSGGQRRRFRVWNQHFLNFMPSLWSEVQLTYVLIMTVFLGIFRAIDIGLHSRDLHTAQSAHSAMFYILQCMIFNFVQRHLVVSFSYLQCWHDISNTNIYIYIFN